MEKLTIRDASIWASNYLGRIVTPANITYLVNYGRIKKIVENGQLYVSCSELKNYYESYNGMREIQFTKRIGSDLNWALSFDNIKEAETTKHVHRLHPYKGKFIPQLVEYFLDDHTDDFKRKVYFQKGDIVLDPFCGSGTTLVQANELGIHAIGIDISQFNTLISNVKIAEYDLFQLKMDIQKITVNLQNYINQSKITEFDNDLSTSLSKYNDTYFPSPDFKILVREGEIDEKEYGDAKEKDFLPIYYDLIKKYNINLTMNNPHNFLEKWYVEQILNEIYLVDAEIQKIQNQQHKALLSVILSRTMRSCRATTHSDLATLKDPVVTTYYCRKHGKICKPLFSIMKWWNTYTKDTLKRIEEFSRYRTNTFQICLTGDSRRLNILSSLSLQAPTFRDLVEKQKIQGIFSSPPYVGLINYHEQHAYAYDLFKFERMDKFEIGPLYMGSGLKAQESYVQGISDVLINAKKYLVPDFDIFLVANDKYNLYPKIAEISGMQILEQFKRPVLNRTEKDKGAYSEIIFHLGGV